MTTRDSGRRARVAEAIMTLAADQHGMVTRAQLLGAGMSEQAVARRVNAKLLRRLHAGVYLVGPMIAPRAMEMAATLACGASAVVSHFSAAVLWALLARRDRAAPVDISIAHGDRRRPGIRIHRVRGLRPDETTRLDGIPVTTPARTLLDLAGVVPEQDLQRALGEALANRLTSQAALLRLVARSFRARGVHRLRSLLESVQPGFTRSEAEGRFLALIRKVKLPLPETNIMVGGYEVDFYWRTVRLVVEIDGFAFHSSARSFESDRRRDAVLAAAGVRVIRVTWRHLVDEPEAVVVRLAQALGRSATAQ